MAVTGDKPTTDHGITGSGTAWSNPTNPYNRNSASGDTVFAATANMTSGNTSQQLQYRDFVLLTEDGGPIANPSDAVLEVQSLRIRARVWVTRATALALNVDSTISVALYAGTTLLHQFGTQQGSNTSGTWITLDQTLSNPATLRALYGHTNSLNTNLHVRIDAGATGANLSSTVTARVAWVVVNMTYAYVATKEGGAKMPGRGGSPKQVQVVKPAAGSGAVDVTTYREAVLADSPYIFWTMNEGGALGGATVADSSGNGRSGTGNGSVAGGALSGGDSLHSSANFAGGRIDAAVNGPAATDAWTVELWFRRTSTATSMALLSKAAASINSGALLYLITAGHDLNFRPAGNSGATATWTAAETGITTNAWFHLVLTFDPVSNNAELFINGVSKGVKTNTSDWAGTTLKVGQAPDNTLPFTGQIDGFATYSGILSSARAAAHYAARDALDNDTTYASFVRADEPWLYYRLEEAAGATAISDDTANARHGTVAGTVAFDQAAVGGIEGTGKWADFQGGRLDATSQNLPASSDRWTLTAWIRRDTATNSQTVFSRAGAVASHMHAFFVNANMGFSFRPAGTGGGTYTWSAAESGMVLGEWHYLALTFDPGAQLAELFVDGVSKGTKATTETSWGGTGNFRIGQNADGTAPFDGGINEVAIYRRLVPVSRLLAHYNARATATPPQVSAGNGGISAGAGGASKQLVAAMAGGARAAGYGGTVTTAKQAVKGAAGGQSAMRGGEVSRQVQVVRGAAGAGTALMGGSPKQIIAAFTGGGRTSQRGGTERQIIVVKGSGGAMTALRGGGPKAVESVKAGGSRQALAGGAPKQVFPAKAGGGILGLSGGAPKLVERQAAGGGKVPMSGGASKSVESVRAGGAAGPMAGGSPKTVTLTKDGGAILAFAGGGPKALTVQKAGGAAVPMRGFLVQYSLYTFGISGYTFDRFGGLAVASRVVLYRQDTCDRVAGPSLSDPVTARYAFVTPSPASLPVTYYVTMHKDDYQGSGVDIDGKTRENLVPTATLVQGSEL